MPMLSPLRLIASPRPSAPMLMAALIAVISTRALSDDVDPHQRERVEQGSPVALERAAAAMTVPPGFHVELVAGEPDVRQPMALSVDPMGRLWVVENDSYPVWNPSPKNRVLVFEPPGGGGGRSGYRRSVFVEGLNYPSGVLVGRGGVWVLDAPNLLFYPMQDGADRPSGPTEVRLTGWSAKGVHNLANSLIWGPDGWLYGCNGTIFDIAIGAPGVPDADRVKLNRGVWRYHPVTRVFEKVAEGTANPWGLDYDEQGEFVMSNNVVSHLWHVLPGGHYPRVNWGNDSGPYTFEMIPTIADHLHWGGDGDWTTSRGGEGIHSVAGGGHSHAGCMIYLGESFPARYRGTVFACNTHGHRVNNDRLEARGSGFTARHAPDFLMANDPWFKGVSLQYGPDGAVYCIDWSDTGECHDVDVTDREHGRLHRVSYGETSPEPVNLWREASSRLVELQRSRNEWMVRQARVVLAQRGLDPASRRALESMLEQATDPVHRLRALWTLHAGTDGGVPEERLFRLLRDRDPHVRGWAIRLLSEKERPLELVRAAFAAMAQSDPSPVVRLSLTIALQRLPVEQRRAILEGLVQRGEDAADPNLPWMIWYALEPVVGRDPKAALEWMPRMKIPKVREWVARRVASQ